jgi:pimeloyl-ACP methyl ester carboxylesterase
MTTEGSTVTLASGLTLSYTERGATDATALVLLPGPTDSRWSYQPVLERMPSSIRTIAVSQRGHGDSDKPAAGYRVEDFSADVVPLLDALRIEQKRSWPGIRARAWVARRVAIDNPERVSGFVLEASPTTLRDDEVLRKFVESVVWSLEDPIDPDVARSLVVDTSSGGLGNEMLDRLVAELLKVPALVWRETLGGLLEYDDAAELGHIGSPALLIWGGADVLVRREMQDQLSERMSHVELLVYPGVGHTPRWEAPSRFAADVAAFVERIEPTG